MANDHKHDTSAREKLNRPDSSANRIGLLAVGIVLMMAIVLTQRLSADLMGTVIFTVGLLLLGISPALLTFVALRLIFRERFNTCCANHRALIVTAFLALCVLSLAVIAACLHINHSLKPILRDIVTLATGV